jgi:type I restriction enzyme S subunit
MITNNIKFEEIFSETTKLGLNVKISEILKNGDLPVIDQSKSSITGFVNDHQYKYKGELPCLLFGDHTRIVKYIDFDFAIGSEGSKIFTIKDGINPKYAYYLLKNYKLPKTGYDRGYKFLKQATFNIHDLEDQIKIVNKLDNIYSLLQKRKNSILLIDKIIDSTFVDMFGDPMLNKKQLETIKLRNLGNWQSGGTPTRKKAEYFEGTIPWFSSGELNSIYISNSKEKITETAIEESSSKKIEKGSLLLGMYDTAALKSSITKVNISSCNQAVAFAKLDETLCNTLYVYFAVQLSKKRYLDQRLGARQMNLNLTKIKNIEIPIPKHVDNQNEFGKNVEALLEQKNKSINSLNNLEVLFKSIIKQAFDGDGLTEKNGVSKYLEDIVLQQELIDKINNQEFEIKEEYDSAKKLLFALLESENSKIKQIYNPIKQKVELQMK